MKYLIVLAAAATLTCATLPSQAHHAATAFDKDRPLDVTGTVKEFKWLNPHVFLYLLVPNGQGGLDEWDVEGPSVVSLIRSQWTKDTLKPGDKVKVLIAPRKDGTHGGTFMQATLADGRVLGTGRL
jgi:hypothetical protein